MSNFKCEHCGATHYDCGIGGYKTHDDIKLEDENAKLRAENKELKADNKILAQCQEVDFGATYIETVETKAENIELKKLLEECIVFLGYVDAVTKKEETRKNLYNLFHRIDKTIRSKKRKKYKTRKSNSKPFNPNKAILETASTLFCTNFKDKTGRMIYLGDILKDENDCICFVVQEENEVWIQSPGSEAMSKEPESFYAKCKVIGNAYENPELLQ